MAELLESIRARLLDLRFSANHAKTKKEKALDYVSKARPKFESYTELIEIMQRKRKERKALTEERDALPLLAISKKRELTEQIQGLTEEIEELKNEETAILHHFHKEEALQKMAAQPSKRGTISKQARKEISNTITAADEAARRHAEREATFEEQYRAERSRFDETLSEAADLDHRAIASARLAIRPEKEQAAFEEIKRAFQEKLSVFANRDTIAAVDLDLHERNMKRPVSRNEHLRNHTIREER